MSTKPKAKKFRIRRSGPLGSGRPVAEQDQIAAPVAQSVEDGFDAPRPAITPKTHLDDPAAQQQQELGIDREIAEIRKEGLTGRQLRMARRMAMKYGLAPTSDFDAVRLLRKRGIDPFQRSNLLEVVPNGNGPAPAKPEAPRTQLPQTVPHPSKNLPSTEFSRESGMAQVHEIQQQLAKRRRRKSILLMARLAIFVMLPTVLVGYYYFNIATPMYATKSEFVIQQSESAGGGGLGGLFAGTGLAVQQDSIAVQSYLTSRDAMQRLDDDLGFKSHFSQPAIDSIQRLPDSASREQAYKVYKRNVKLSYDPTEGILKMEVAAADPATSAAFSEALISYAEQRVDSLTQRLREDQMSGARESYEDAERKVDEAQARVLELQERLGVLDPASETSSLMSQIATFERQLREKTLQLDQLLDNSRPNQARVDGVRGDIRRLEALIADLRSSLTISTSSGDSLARVSAELRIAEADLSNRQLLLSQALQQLETARIEANRQVRYLSLGVTPVPPDEPTYPRAFENTLLAFLVFAGIYLMISMTAAILREQISA